MNNGRYRFDAKSHIHLLDGQPLIGTSTAVQAIAKEGLTWWSAELAAVTCLESGEHIPTIRAEYEAICALNGKDKKNARDRLQRKYPIFKKARYAHKEKKESAAQPGTDMHRELELYVAFSIEANHGEPMHPMELINPTPEVFRFAEWAVNNVREFIWAEAHCYSERLWTGGICDCGAILKLGNAALGIIDFKSSREAYFAQFVQAGGYARQIRENGLFSADGSTINTAIRLIGASALIVFPFGGTCEPVIKRNVLGYQAAFEAAVAIHKLQKLFEDGADFEPVRNFSGANNGESAQIREGLTSQIAGPIGVTAAIAEISRRNR